MPATPKKGRRFGGDAAHQRLMMANLVSSLIAAEGITTTEAKAKALRPIAEKVITKARKGGLHNHRQILAYIGDQEIAAILMDEAHQRAKHVQRRDEHELRRQVHPLAARPHDLEEPRARELRHRAEVRDVENGDQVLGRIRTGLCVPVVERHPQAIVCAAILGLGRHGRLEPPHPLPRPGSSVQRVRPPESHEEEEIPGVFRQRDLQDLTPAFGWDCAYLTEYGCEMYRLFCRLNPLRQVDQLFKPVRKDGVTHPIPKPIGIDRCENSSYARRRSVY